MANFSDYKQIFQGDTLTFGTTQLFELGSRAVDANGNEYIYLKGVASTAAGSWVTYNPSTGVTALLAADAMGPVAIAQSACVANNYGWYIVKGTYATSASDTVSGAGVLYIDGTAGRVDDAGVAGDFVFGAYSTAADTTNVLPVSIQYPFVSNGGYLV